MIKTFDNIDKNPPNRVAVIGAAKSGIAAAKYFHDKNARVFVSDTCSREKLDAILRDNNLTDEFVESEAGGHGEKILDCELVILSPGVRGDIDILKRAAAKNIPIWSEMELGFCVSKAPFIALTGSSGKSTTVSLLHSAMCEAGFDAHLCGNIGTPVIEVVPKLSSASLVVAEVSSFQLETIEKFKPKTAAVINLMKNHLDRYDNEDDYYNAKKRIANNLTNSEYLILNYDDARLLKWADEFKSSIQIIMFGADESVKGKFENCVYLHDGAILYRFNGDEGAILDNVSRMKIGGKHNYINACAAAAAALTFNADPKQIGEGLCKFGGLPHRLEYVGEIDGVSFYNDSKSTTAESIECALRAFGEKVHLIAGGKDKGCDYDAIKNTVRDFAKSITLIGETKEKIENVWNGLAPIKKFDTLEDAVAGALKNAARGEKIIFSPGCSSFDMFLNYEHRGDVFREIIHNYNADRVYRGEANADRVYRGEAKRSQ